MPAEATFSNRKGLMIRYCVSGLASGVLTCWSAFAQSPLTDITTTALDGPLYTFDLTITSGADTATLSVDPSQPTGERIQSAPDDSDFEKSFAQRLAARIESIESSERDGGLWCSSLAETVPAAPEPDVLSETETSITYGYQPIVESDDSVKNPSQYLTAELVVAKEAPQILSYRMFAEKPFKPNSMVKVSEMDVRITCAPGPDGRTYRAEAITRLSASAFFQKIRQQDTERISNLQPLITSE